MVQQQLSGVVIVELRTVLVVFVMYNCVMSVSIYECMRLILTVNWMIACMATTPGVIDFVVKVLLLLGLILCYFHTHAERHIVVQFHLTVTTPTITNKWGRENRRTLPNVLIIMRNRGSPTNKRCWILVARPWTVLQRPTYELSSIRIENCRVLSNAYLKLLTSSIYNSGINSGSFGSSCAGVKF